MRVNVVTNGGRKERKKEGTNERKKERKKLECRLRSHFDLTPLSYHLFSYLLSLHPFFVFLHHLVFFSHFHLSFSHSSFLFFFPYLFFILPVFKAIVSFPSHFFHSSDLFHAPYFSTYSVFISSGLTFFLLSSGFLSFFYSILTSFWTFSFLRHFLAHVTTRRVNERLNEWKEKFFPVFPCLHKLFTLGTLEQSETEDWEPRSRGQKEEEDFLLRMRIT